MTTVFVLLGLLAGGIVFEAGYEYGRRAAANQLRSAFEKLPLRYDIRAAIVEGLKQL